MFTPCLLMRTRRGISLVGAYSAVWAYTPAMRVSTGTVITHQSNLYAKLGVHSRAGLLAALLSM
jgi:Bacterial regulatory proteins, luxR family